jgi:hypothetical protein
MHWANGGTTDLLNCFLLCYQHHRMMHSKDQPWIVQGDANGVLTFIAPNGDTTAAHHQWSSANPAC